MSTEHVTRSYIDSFSVKTYGKEQLVPKYFTEPDVSDLNVGLLGYTTELISDGLEDTFNTVSTLHDEMFPNRAKLPSSIMSHAAIFQLNSGVATSATCDFVLILDENYVISNRDSSGQFYIDKNTKIIVEGVVFTLDYDIVIRGVKRELTGYVYSAQYLINYDNSISHITTPYIPINKSTTGKLTLRVTCRQCQRVDRFEEIINNTKINLPSFTFPYDTQLAGFEVFYKSPSDTDYNVQLVTIPEFSTPRKDAFCYYAFSDSNELTIFFSNRDTYFQPEFNSELKVILYLTDGTNGNFESYSGANVEVITSSDVYTYNDNFVVLAQVLTASTGGGDTITLEELQALTVEGFRTATVYVTDNDLMEYFNNYKYRYDNECSFVKSRDDVERVHSGFLIMKQADYIYPTNTVDIDTNLDELTNTDINKYIIDPGQLFTYNNDGNVSFIVDEDEKATQEPIYEQYLIDNGLTKEELSFWKFLDDNGIDIRYTLFDPAQVEKAYDLYQFVYTNPFLISITKSPNLIGFYLTTINQNVYLDFLSQNLEIFDQFIATNMNVRRLFDGSGRYTFKTSLFPSSTIADPTSIITVFNDKSRTNENQLRVVVTIEDNNGNDLCFIELIPMEMNSGGIFTFEGSVLTDDHVTSTSNFRLIDGFTKMVGTDTMLIPMSTVVNMYVLYKSSITNNVFAVFDSTFENYTWTNIYSTDNDKIAFIKPLNMVRSELKFKDYHVPTVQVNDCQLTSIPFLGTDAALDDDRFAYFITTYADQYRNLEAAVDYLRTSTYLDIKFYNTYGKSKNFIIGDEIDGENLIDTINISIQYYIWLQPDTDVIKADRELKLYIKDYIESINIDGTNSFYNSNLMRSVESTFSYVHHMKFIGINSYDSRYQTVQNITVDLLSLSKLERIKYVPEILVINQENINLTFFDI